MTGSDVRKSRSAPRESPRRLRWVWRDGLVSRLEADGQEIGSLVFSGTHGSLAVSDSELGHWTFKRYGFLRPKIIIRAAGSGSNYAVASMNWKGGGILEVSGGPTFQIRRSGYWRPQLDVSDTIGNRLLNLRIDRRSEEATVEGKAGVPLSQLEYLLASLAWYIVILSMRYENDAGTVAAVITPVLAAGGV